MDHSKTRTIRVMDKEYQINCPDGHEEELREAAYLVDRRMRNIRQGGRVVGLERIAIMTALNVAHELVVERSGRATGELSVTGFEERILTLQNKIDGALSDVGETHFSRDAIEPATEETELS